MDTGLEWPIHVLYPSYTRNMCTQEPLARFTVCLFWNIQGNDLRMQIFPFPPTFQETVGSHLKPSLPVVGMAIGNIKSI